MKGGLKRLLEDKVFWRSMLRIAFPVAMQNLLASSLALIDSLMVGQLGDTALAAVGIGSQLSFFANILMFGIVSGGAVFAAQYWGSKNMKGISKALGVMLCCNVPIALVFVLLGLFIPERLIALFSPEDASVIQAGADYIRIAMFSQVGLAFNLAFSTTLRSTEEVKIPFITSGVSVVTNLVLNYILIYGKLGLPAMGVEGAAVATAVSAVLGPLLMYLMSLKKKNAISAGFRELFGFDREFVALFFKKALPVMFNEGLWSLGVMVYNAIFARMGTDCYAALTIFRTVENIAFVFFMGLCHSCNVLVGKNVGAGQTETAKLYAKRFILLIPFLAIVVGGLVIAFRNPILMLYAETSDSVRNTAATLLLIYGLEMGIRNIPYISIVGIFRAGGDTKVGMYFDIGTLWMIALPATYLCGLVWELPFVTTYLVMMLSEDLLKVVLCLIRFFSMKWIKPVVNLGPAETGVENG